MQFNEDINHALNHTFYKMHWKSMLSTIHKSDRHVQAMRFSVLCTPTDSFNTLASGRFGDFHTRTTRSHVALHAHNSGVESGRELFKGSKDTESLLVCTQNKFFDLGLQIFCEWRHKWRTFRPPWRTSPDPGCKPLMVVFHWSFYWKLGYNPSLLILWMTVQKLWSKVIKIFD